MMLGMSIWIAANYVVLYMALAQPAVSHNIDFDPGGMSHYSIPVEFIANLHSQCFNIGLLPCTKTVALLRRILMSLIMRSTHRVIQPPVS